MDKYIKDVFKDFSLDTNLQEAKVENVNLYKKQDRLQVDLISDKPITIKEIGEFENYLQSTLKVSKALTNIKYNNVQIKPDIESDWSNIVSYITSKEPLSRAMLTNSTVKIENQNVDVNLKIKGAEFLCSKKFDKGLEHILQNIYNEKYCVRINDCLDDDYYAHIEQEMEEEEKKAIVRAEKELEERIRQNQESLDSTIESQNSSENNSQSKSTSQRKSSQGTGTGFGYGPKSQNKSFEKPLKELPEGMLYGRNPKIVGTPIKIASITTETENVVVDGEVVRVDSNEMRSKPDKAILIFDLYDGTSTMTCKAFVDKAQLKDLTKKLDGKRNKS